MSSLVCLACKFIEEITDNSQKLIRKSIIYKCNLHKEILDAGKIATHYCSDIK